MIFYGEKMSNRFLSKSKGKKRSALRPGFTLIELLVGSTVMLVVVVAALSLYMTSNKVAVDQNMYAELQQDVRSGMYFVTRDLRMAGVGLPAEFSGYYLEGTDNEDQGAGASVNPDRILFLGNMEDPFSCQIQNYNGSSINLSTDDFCFEQHPYSDEYYENKMALVVPNPSLCSAAQVRQITHVTHNEYGTNEKLNFSPGLAPGINPPGGLSGTCDESSDYDGGYVTFINVIEYWLDLTGNYPGLTAGQDGYIGNGQGSILYMTMNAKHFPLAQNVENLQFEYNGDMDNNGQLDGFVPWQNTWTIDQVLSIRQIRILVLGRTPRPFVSVSGRAPGNIYLYQRPILSNDPNGLGESDRRKRFLLESTSNIRNLSLNVYNTGTR